MLTAADLRASFTALITPFEPGNLEVDEVALRELVDWQIAAGTGGIVAVGTTGEAATLSQAEHRRVVEIVISQVAGRVPVIAGAGSNNTREAVELAEHALAAGSDAVLAISPYYNKPTQEGIYKHYLEIAAVGIPVIIYNVPSRTGKNVEAATTLRLATHPQIIGVKEASGDLKQVQEICENKPADFAVLSGEDAQTLKILKLGGVGSVGVVQNELPGEMQKLVQTALAGDWLAAEKLQKKYAPLMAANFADNNPMDVKWALHLLQRVPYAVRLPLTEPGEEAKKAIAAALSQVGLLK